MYLLKQSTAGQEVPLGYFLDSSDGDTEETGLTIANTDIKLHKTGATTLANKNSGGGTHISNGVYYATFDATDTDTLGPMTVFVHVSGALAVRLECMVVTSARYDVLTGTTANTPSDVVQISGDSTAADNAEAFFDGTGYAGTNNVIPSVTTVTGNVEGSVASVAGSVGSVTGGVGGNVVGSVASVVGSVGSVTGNVGGNVVGSVGSVTGHTPQTGDTYALANGATGFTAIDTVVDSILEDTSTTIPATITTAQNDLDILTGTNGAVLDSTNDVYHALIEYVFDSPVDEYTVTWFKNGARVSSGITSPTIQVIKRTDGTDLVASTAMTQIGSSGSYKYNESSNVINANESYLAVTSATIDSGSRSFACLVSRSA